MYLPKRAEKELKLLEMQLQDEEELFIEEGTCGVFVHSPIGRCVSVSVFSVDIMPFFSSISPRKNSHPPRYISPTITTNLPQDATYLLATHG